MQNKSNPSQRWISWSETGLRRKLRFRSKIGAFFLQVVPWINVAVIAALFITISRMLTISPSVNFELPAAPFSEGAESGATLVMIRGNALYGGPSGNTDMAENNTLAFFEDIRYRIGSDDERKLAEHISFYVRKFNGTQILLLADKNVLHGDVMKVVNIVRNAGIKRVNVAVKPEE